MLRIVVARRRPMTLARSRFEALQKQLPFICTASTKANCAKRYPSEILAGLLYLGDWANAEATDRYGDLNIRRHACDPREKNASMLVADLRTSRSHLRLTGELWQPPNTHGYHFTARLMLQVGGCSCGRRCMAVRLHWHPP